MRAASEMENGNRRRRRRIVDWVMMVLIARVMKVASRTSGVSDFIGVLEVK